MENCTIGGNKVLTIVLTTFNRPQYLSRLLNYFCGSIVKHRIIIADASKLPHLERNKEIIDSISNVLNVHHLVWDSSTDGYEVVVRSLEQVKTRYVVWVADDDFVVPPSLDSVIEFMDSNTSYEAAQGKQIQFTTFSDGPYSTSLKTAPLSMVDFSVEGASAVERIRKRMSQNTRLSAPKTVYSIMRTSNALRLYKEVLALGLDYSNTEGLMNQMLLLSGNIKLIDRLYIARQYGTSNAAVRAHSRFVPIITQPSTGDSYEDLVDRSRDEKILHPPDYFDQLTDPLFPIQYDRKVTCLANELARNDNISIEEACKIIKYWNWYFLAKNMMPKFYEHSGYHQQTTIATSTKSISKRLRQWARNLPGLQRTWWKVSGGKMSLAALLRPKSPFYEDFLPIYRAITASPAQADININEPLV